MLRANHAVVLSTLISLLTVTPVASFGHELLTDFAFRDNYTCLNHGSYGSAPRPVLDALRDAEMEMEACPDCWFRYEVYKKVDAVRARLAALIGADPLDLVFVPNASNGVNAVIRSIAIPPGSLVLRLNIAYTMVKNTMIYVDGTDRVLIVNVSMPSSNDEIVAAVAAALDAHSNVVLASFSHIASLPAVVLPVVDLAALCRSRGVLVLIDGAHALGQIPVNVATLGADFWLGNAHKWLHGPKGERHLHKSVMRTQRDWSCSFFSSRSRHMSQVVLCYGLDAERRLWLSLPPSTGRGRVNRTFKQHFRTLVQRATLNTVR